MDDYIIYLNKICFLKYIYIYMTTTSMLIPSWSTIAIYFNDNTIFTIDNIKNIITNKLSNSTRLEKYTLGPLYAINNYKYINANYANTAAANAANSAANGANGGVNGAELVIKYAQDVVYYAGLSGTGDDIDSYIRDYIYTIYRLFRDDTNSFLTTTSSKATTILKQSTNTAQQLTTTYPSTTTQGLTTTTYPPMTTYPSTITYLPTTTISPSMTTQGPTTVTQSTTTSPQLTTTYSQSTTKIPQSTTISPQSTTKMVLNEITFTSLNKIKFIGNIVNNKITLTNIILPSKSGTILKIPETMTKNNNKYTVTNISAIIPANTKIKNLTLPKGIIKIDPNAFTNLSNLTTVNFLGIFIPINVNVFPNNNNKSNKIKFNVKSSNKNNWITNTDYVITKNKKYSYITGKNNRAIYTYPLSFINISNFTNTQTCNWNKIIFIMCLLIIIIMTVYILLINNELHS